MTLEELRDRINEICDGCEHPAAVEVRLAMQPSYPMSGRIENLCVEHGDGHIPVVVWIACSGHTGYDCPSTAWDESEIPARGGGDGED